MERRKIILLSNENYNNNRKWGLDYTKKNYTTYIFIDKEDIRAMYNSNKIKIKDNFVRDLETFAVKDAILQGYDVILMSNLNDKRWMYIKKDYDHILDIEIEIKNDCEKKENFFTKLLKRINKR